MVTTDILIEQLTSQLQDSKVSDVLPSNSISLIVVFQGEESFQKALNLRKTIISNFNCDIITTQTEKDTNAIVDIVFGTNLISTATYESASCCIIKPHAVKDRISGLVIDEIVSAGFEISAAESLFFDRSKAEEFLEVYKGVIPEYIDQAVQLSSGLCIALEVRGQDAVGMLRRVAGPWDVNIARELFPNSIRGKYAVDKIRSVVHCTDLEEDAKLECQYCFRIMA